MSNVRRLLENLRSNFNELIPSEIKLKPLNKTKEIADKIDKELMGKDFEQPHPASVKKIIYKISQGVELTRKESKDLPFVLVDKDCDSDIMKVCFKSIDLTRERILKRLVLVYFTSFGTIDVIKKQVLQALISKGLSRDNYSPRTDFMKKMKYFSKVLFTEKCLNNMARMIDVLGIEKVGDHLSLPEVLKYSGLIVEAVKQYYMDIKLDIAGKVNQLYVVQEQHESFSSILPFIADYTILQVRDFNQSELSKYKKICLQVFYELLGDPRLSRWKVRWNEVSESSRKTFMSWLAENDLNLFFTIIEKTSVDRMWKYRKEFWKRYLPYITNTWVLFGKDAMYYVNQIEKKKLGYGKLGKGTTANQSVFTFQIDKYIFVEWSHNGKLRVWDIESAPRMFGTHTLDKTIVSNAQTPPLEEWSHMSPETGNWQRKVDRWIYRKCGLDGIER